MVERSKIMSYEPRNKGVDGKGSNHQCDQHGNVNITPLPAVTEAESTDYVLEHTLFRGTSGVDVSGIQRGAGHTGITITPSLSLPKKSKKKS
jgi:hypothetical protein